ncbi:hypothetical protein B0H66DRAFT_554915 [Apodospora peruviana]|uniref:Uncharacterized protein n=1 Tax=Apodospora peruviana TaxID=516989 RepID=A0AAE0M8D4_9PEZI|nr:hypothetical protein B0H66DRAFT_554915 [Apodospora peruviana]
MPSTIPVHIVSKQNNAVHQIHHLLPDGTLGPLAPSSVRARTALISVTSNNLTYARGGATPGLFWWDAYPVPSSAGGISPEEWGIVPAWGYARIIESTVPSITPDSLVWGFWPTSAHPVDLRLEPLADGPAGHFCETSPHRGRLMTLYNRYVVMARATVRCETDTVSSTSLESNRAVTTATCRPVWEAGYLLNHSVFPTKGSGVKPVEPLGFGGLWSEEDADLRDAAVVSLGAGTKTARSFAWNLARNRSVDADGPLGLLQLTSVPGTLAKFDTGLPIKSLRYDELKEGVEWALGFNPRRIVVVDCGSSAKAVEELAEALSSSVEEMKVTVVAVGQEAKVYSDEEYKAHVATWSRKAVTKVQLNTSGVADRAKETSGVVKYFEELEGAWGRCVNEKGLGEFETVWFHGVEGDKGVEGAWTALCDRKMAANASAVVRMD